MKKVKFHKYILLIVLLLQGMGLFAQKEANIWYFGTNAGLNFNNSPPAVLTNSAMRAFEGCTSIADRNGNLLFYSDGITVWNKNHQIMTNGTGLSSDSSSTQSALVIKYPGNDSLYYIFTSGQTGSAKGVCYSIIDMKLSGNLGAVTTKNIKLVNISSEKIAAINHVNQRDIWVAIPAHGSDTIYTYLVTPQGINLNAVKSTNGLPILSNFNIGQMKFSNDASKLILADRYNNRIIVSNFNNLTGIISNTIVINDNINFTFNSFYGLEISPSSKYLYVTVNDKKLVQCLIPSSTTNRENVCKTIDSSSLFPLGCLQLGPDGKIYCAKFGSSFLGIINNPDDYYTNCGFVDDAIFLNGRLSKFGLPAFYQTFFSPKGLINANISCLGDSSHISINIDTTLIDSINWYIGDTIKPIIRGSKYKYFKYFSSDTSTKVILAKVYSSFVSQNYYGSLVVKPIPILNLLADTSICVGDSIILKATSFGANYVWQDGKTDSVHKVKTPGLYKVISTLNGCSVEDSTRITVNPYPYLNLGKDTLLCDSTNYKLDATYSGANIYGKTVQQILFILQKKVDCIGFNLITMVV